VLKHTQEAWYAPAISRLPIRATFLLFCSNDITPGRRDPHGGLDVLFFWKHQFSETRNLSKVDQTCELWLLLPQRDDEDLSFCPGEDERALDGLRSQQKRMFRSIQGGGHQKKESMRLLAGFKR
jgi:hypothetical protein